LATKNITKNVKSENPFTKPAHGRLDLCQQSTVPSPADDIKNETGKYYKTRTLYDPFISRADKKTGGDLKKTCKTVKQNEHDHSHKKESTPVVDNKPNGKFRL